MKRISITGSGSYVFEEFDAPRPRSGQLIIAPLRCGICATDMELLDGTMVYLRNGIATWPFTPGHEWVGVVVDAGDSTFSVGDLVVGECTIGCWDCPACDSGNYHQCPNRRETGLFGQGGALAEFLAFPARSTHLIPPSSPATLEDFALVEPTGIAYKGIQRLNMPKGQKILITGGGTIGYLATGAAQADWDAEVVFWASRPASCGRLEELGARPIGDSEKVDYIFDTAGTEKGFAAAFKHLNPRGRISSVSFTGKETIQIPIDELVTNDWDFYGSLGSPNVWPEVIELISAGTTQPGKLLTDTFPLSEYSGAIELIRARKPETAKVMIVPHPSKEAALAAASKFYDV
ncbi:MAG: zinc-binding dehydrogenase [Propionibacteriaceae bacterium]|jgi:threonine dehydrogenase-like Zn-dependent dehydrogenase|nr:zinc-binding dehydrogenase [Propionibacteriaceae bacterium]